MLFTIRSLASSIRSTRRTVEPSLVLNFLPSEPNTTPKPTCSTTLPAVTQPAFFAPLNSSCDKSRKAYKRKQKATRNETLSYLKMQTLA